MDASRNRIAVLGRVSGCLLLARTGRGLYALSSNVLRLGSGLRFGSWGNGGWLSLGASVGSLCHSSCRFHSCSVRGRRSCATSLTSTLDLAEKRLRILPILIVPVVPCGMTETISVFHFFVSREVHPICNRHKEQSERDIEDVCPSRQMDSAERQ